MELPDRVSHALQHFSRRRVAAHGRAIELPAVGDIDGWRRAVSDQTDALGLGIDEPIQELIAQLNAHGIETSGSCAGHVAGAHGREGTRLPYIDLAHKADLPKLQALLDEMEIDTLLAPVPDHPNPDYAVFRMEATLLRTLGREPVGKDGEWLLSLEAARIFPDHERLASLDATERAALDAQIGALEDMAAGSLGDIQVDLARIAQRLEQDLQRGRRLGERVVSVDGPAAPAHDL